MFKQVFVVLGVVFCLYSCSSKFLPQKKPFTPFNLDNLIAWSIVAFDNQDRDPATRLDMLQELGFQQYAFGGRAKHIARMEEELNLAKEKGIKVRAVWLYMNHHKDEPGQLKPQSEQVFSALKSTGLQTQVWVGFHPEYVNGLSYELALEKTSKMVRYLCQRADSLGCKIALYNHGGWFGEPEHQLAIIRQLPQYDIGIIYNFHHGHTHLDRYPQIFDQIMPYLWCVNLNGMKKGGPKIMTIGKGDFEQGMVDALLHKGYKGPFGVLGHVKGGDAKVILQENLQGIRKLQSLIN